MIHCGTNDLNSEDTLQKIADDNFFFCTNYNCIQYLTMTQSKLSLSNLKSANLNLVRNQMQFRNHRLRDP